MEEHISIKNIIEAFLFASDTPITPIQMKDAIGEIDIAEIKNIISALQKEYDDQNRSFMIVEVASGYQIITRPVYANWLKKLVKGKYESRHSIPSLETLAIIVYKQPVTKLDIESIRGVNVDGVIKTLLEKGLVRIVGRREVPGRPFVYGTTKKFLEYFGLKSIQDLPNIEEFVKSEMTEEIVAKEAPDATLEETTPKN